MPTAYQDSKSAKLAETGLSVASQIAWVVPGLEPLGAILGAIGTIVGASDDYDDGQPSNQDLKDAIDALQVEMEAEWFNSHKNVISDLRDQVMVADVANMTNYDENPKFHYASDGKNGGTDILKPGEDLLSALTDNNSDTLHALRALSNYPSDKGLAVSNLGVYILGRTYFHLQIVHRLQICKAVWTYDGSTHKQDRAITSWEDCDYGLMEQLALSLESGLDYAEPLLKTLKKAFLERPRKAREQTQNLINKLQAFPIAFRQFTGDNHLDKITEEEVDAHLKTVFEWRKTLALKCRKPYKDEKWVGQTPLQFLFESDVNGDTVGGLENTKLLDGKIAAQCAGINSGNLGGPGTFAYYQIDDADPEFKRALAAAGQLDGINLAMRESYDRIFGKGRWQADRDLQLPVEHYDTMISMMALLEPSAGHIGSDVQALIYSFGPRPESMNIAPAGDGTQLGDRFYPAGWAGIADIYEKLYYDALQKLANWNKRAAAKDSTIKPFSAFRIKLLACGNAPADDAVLAQACERILRGLQNAAKDYPDAADIVIIVGGDPARRAITAAAIKEFSVEVNMRGFQLPIPNHEEKK
ncbi:MAG: hypothetical protein ACT4NX_01895 [Deltaproteobacteria bacterium]